MSQLETSIYSAFSLTFHVFPMIFLARNDFPAPRHLKALQDHLPGRRTQLAVQLALFARHEACLSCGGMLGCLEYDVFDWVGKPPHLFRVRTTTFFRKKNIELYKWDDYLAGMRTSAICCMFATGKSTMMLSWAGAELPIGDAMGC